jgi:hypothetical protein
MCVVAGGAVVVMAGSAIATQPTQSAPAVDVAALAAPFTQVVDETLLWAQVSSAIAAPYVAQQGMNLAAQSTGLIAQGLVWYAEATGAGGGAPHDDQPAPASKLRAWAKNQGYVQRPGTGTPEGGPETWEDSATGEWKLKLKLPSARPGLHEDSQKPRFSAKDKNGNYHNPLDGTSGTRKTHGHIPLDPDS